MLISLSRGELGTLSSCQTMRCWRRGSRHGAANAKQGQLCQDLEKQMSPQQLTRFNPLAVLTDSKGNLEGKQCSLGTNDVPDTLSGLFHSICPGNLGPLPSHPIRQRRNPGLLRVSHLSQKDHLLSSTGCVLHEGVCPRGQMGAEIQPHTGGQAGPRACLY